MIDAAKAAVPTIDLADRLCGPAKMRRVGAERVGRCPPPDHPDRVPSFAVNPEKNVWYCHGCLRGGDVIELARFAWGYSKAEVAMAAANLLHEFGHPIPQRPKSWYRKQARQKPIRAAIDEAKLLHLQRHVFRIFKPLLEEISDEEERRAETQYLQDAAGEIAILMLAGRMSAAPWEPEEMDQANPAGTPGSASQDPGALPYDGPKLELAPFLKRVEVLAEVRDALGIKYRIRCPWIAEHGDAPETGTYLGQRTGGGLWFFCNHAHCQGRGWREFKREVRALARSRTVTMPDFTGPNLKVEIRDER